MVTTKQAIHLPIEIGAEFWAVKWGPYWQAGQFHEGWRVEGPHRVGAVQGTFTVRRVSWNVLVTLAEDEPGSHRGGVKITGEFRLRDSFTTQAGAEAEAAHRNTKGEKP